MERLIVIEIGTGVDLQGGDVTKAATRAVRDAIGRTYLAGLGHLLRDPQDRLEILVRLGVPEAAGRPDEAKVKAELPHGEVTLAVTPGGLLAPTGKRGAEICIVNAAVEVWIRRPD